MMIQACLRVHSGMTSKKFTSSQLPIAWTSCRVSSALRTTLTPAIETAFWCLTSLIELEDCPLGM